MKLKVLQLLWPLTFLFENFSVVGAPKLVKDMFLPPASGFQLNLNNVLFVFGCPNRRDSTCLHSFFKEWWVATHQRKELTINVPAPRSEWSWTFIWIECGRTHCSLFFNVYICKKIIYTCIIYNISKSKCMKIYIYRVYFTGDIVYSLVYCSPFQSTFKCFITPAVTVMWRFFSSNTRWWNDSMQPSCRWKHACFQP